MEYFKTYEQYINGYNIHLYELKLPKIKLKKVIKTLKDPSELIPDELEGQDILDSIDKVKDIKEKYDKSIGYIDKYIEIEHHHIEKLRKDIRREKNENNRQKIQNHIDDKQKRVDYLQNKKAKILERKHKALEKQTKKG